MRGAADGLLRLFFVYIGVFKQPQLKLGNQDAAAGGGQPFLIHLVHQLPGRAHARAAQNVRARVGSTGKVQAPVGLDDAGIAHRPAQQIGHDRRALIGGIIHGVAAQIGHGRVAVGHDCRHARVDSGLKARQMQREGILADGQRGAVHAVGLRARAGEVLYGGHDGILRQRAAALQRAHGDGNQLLHHLGILGVALLVAAPAGIGDQVCVRGQRHAHAHGRQLFLEHLIVFFGQLRIVSCAQIDFIRQEGRVLYKGGARFRIHGENDGNAQLGAFGQLLDFVG